MPPELSLMGVVAHPDDESLGLGGIFAKYAAEGVKTYLVTATRGEGGRFHGRKDGPNHPGPEGLGRIREAELRAAAAVLGIHDVALLGYRDTELDRADAREAAGKIAAHIRRLRPQVVLTFSPTGGYGHPDHIAISQFAMAATVVAADPSRDLRGDTPPGAPAGPALPPHAGPALPPHAVSKLYFMASGEDDWAAYQAAFKKLTSVVDGVEREATPWPDWAITTVIDTREQWPTVWRAVSCHDSQIAAYQKLKELSAEHHEALWGKQELYRAFSTVNGGRKREADLFEGLR